MKKEFIIVAIFLFFILLYGCFDKKYESEAYKEINVKYSGSKDHIIFYTNNSSVQLHFYLRDSSQWSISVYGKDNIAYKYNFPLDSEIESKINLLYDYLDPINMQIDSPMTLRYQSYTNPQTETEQFLNNVNSFFAFIKTDEFISPNRLNLIDFDYRQILFNKKNCTLNWDGIWIIGSDCYMHFLSVDSLPAIEYDNTKKTSQSQMNNLACNIFQNRDQSFFFNPSLSFSSEYVFDLIFVSLKSKNLTLKFTYNIKNSQNKKLLNEIQNIYLNLSNKTVKANEK